MTALMHVTTHAHRRTGRVLAVLAVTTIAIVFGSLFLGDYQLTLPQMVATLAGHAPEPQAEFMIWGRRLPRAIVAVLVGAALGMSGAVFQRMTRNPLASPDIIGVSGGAAAGGAFVMLIMGGSLAQVSTGAIVGGVVTAAFIAVIGLRSGSFSMRVVLVGVGIAALSGSAISYLLTRVFVAQAVTAQTWLVGTLQGRNFSVVAPVAFALVISAAFLAMTGRDARMLDLGDELARATGVHVTRVRIVQMLAGTLLVAGAVAVAGPIGFVALASGHIARALMGATSLIAAAFVGAIVLSASDLVAQHMFAVPIPVGTVTIVLGGMFLLWLLLAERKTRG